MGAAALVLIMTDLGFETWRNSLGTSAKSSVSPRGGASGSPLAIVPVQLPSFALSVGRFRHFRKEPTV